MASLIDELMDTLEQENAEYRNLLASAQEKTDAIIKGDIQLLQKLTEDEQIIMGRIMPLDKKREEYTKDVATVIGRPVKEITLTRLIELMDKQPAVKKRLGTIHDALQDTIKQVARVNDMNKGLLKEALELVNFDINLMNSLKQTPLTADYDKTAYNTDIHMLKSGMFDKSQ